MKSTAWLLIRSLVCVQLMTYAIVANQSVVLAQDAAIASSTLPFESDSLPDGLSNRGGCADAFFLASDKNKTLALVIHIPRVIEKAVRQQEQAYFVEVGIEAEGVWATLFYDSDLGDRWCTDVQIPGTLPPEREWKAVSGSLKIDVQPLPRRHDVPWTDALAWLWVRDLVLVDNLGNSIEIKELRFDEVHIGWLPG